MSAELDSLYQEIILDHYKNPHHKGLREPFEAEVHHVNPTCGDEITLRVHLADGVVQDVSYDSVGCSISQASSPSARRFSSCPKYPRIKTALRALKATRRRSIRLCAQSSR